MVDKICFNCKRWADRFHLSDRQFWLLLQWKTRAQSYLIDLYLLHRVCLVVGSDFVLF